MGIWTGMLVAMLYCITNGLIVVLYCSGIILLFVLNRIFPIF